MPVDGGKGPSARRQIAPQQIAADGRAAESAEDDVLHDPVARKRTVGCLADGQGLATCAGNSRSRLNMLD